LVTIADYEKTSGMLPVNYIGNLKQKEELMLPETKNRNNTKNHSIISVSRKASPQKGTEKYGLLKRFLDWIARGAYKSNIGGTSCPS